MFLMTERSFVYLCFIVLGASALLPWNIFITAHKYFMYKLRNVTADDNATLVSFDHDHPSFSGDAVMELFGTTDVTSGNGSDDRTLTSLQLTFENWLTVTCSVSGLFGSFLNAFLATRVGNQQRMVLGHVIVFVCLTAVAVMTRLDTDQYQKVFFVVTLLLANVANFCSNGLILSACMGLAARFPMEIIQGGQFGQALIAVCIAVTSVVTQAATPHPSWNGLAYFSAGAAFTLLSLGAYLLLIRTIMFQEYARTYMHGMMDEDKDRNSQVERLLSDEEDDDDDDDFDEFGTADRDPVRQRRATASPNANRRADRPTIIGVGRKIWYESVNTMLILFVTLSVFPAVCSLVVSQTKGTTWNQYFVPVACFVLFNLGDAIGRFVTYWLRWPRTGSPLMLLLCVARVGLAVVLLLCNTSPRWHVPVVFASDWQYCSAILLLALTNGYLLSLSNMHASLRCEPDEMELAGSLFGACCVLGVVIGSALSFGLVQLL